MARETRVLTGRFTRTTWIRNNGPHEKFDLWWMRSSRVDLLEIERVLQNVNLESLPLSLMLQASL